MDKTVKPRRPSPLIAIICGVLLISAIATIWNPVVSRFQHKSRFHK